jgi:hypothetical protein
VNCKIGDRDLPRAGTEQSRQLFVEGVEPLGVGGACVGQRAEIEREDGRTLIVGGEQRAVGTEGERSDGCERWAWPVCDTCWAEGYERDVITTRARRTTDLMANRIVRVLLSEGTRYASSSGVSTAYLFFSFAISSSAAVYCPS